MVHEEEKIYRLGGSDPRTGGQRMRDLLRNGMRRQKPEQDEPRPKPGFGEPAEMSEEKKARIRALRQGAAGR